MAENVPMGLATLNTSANKKTFTVNFIHRKVQIFQQNTDHDQRYILMKPGL